MNFALFSAHATRVELCLFDDPEAAKETCRVELPERTGDVWHGRVRGLPPGQLYGYRVHGPWSPGEGHRFNPNKLLVDPYARTLHGPLHWDEALLGHDPADPERPSKSDSAPFVPRCRVVPSNRTEDAREDRPLSTPWSHTVIYECHVKGMTAAHPDVPEAVRGRYSGLASPAVLSHLVDLGVTAVELLPVQHAGVEEHLARRGLQNYWGYATLGFFAPDTRYASASENAIAEFRAMVDAFHEAGIEVLLDVVYNHTPEGGPQGPTLSFRGIDNASYYRLHKGDPSQYTDFTGTGNTLNTSVPRVRQLMLDSLRYWVEEMRVDGFRFDLATAIARDHGDFDPHDPFFEIARQDPVLSRVKLVAEPWDLGPEGYRLGGFPLGWGEWNDRFRDAVRRFWRGDGGQVGELASRLTGSSDVFPEQRGSSASINYVCSHDGFTLRDLVSYSHKHNEANGEGGMDGSHDESHNWGVEGPSESRVVNRMRDRIRRNFVATLALANGVPMWLGGDEVGRTQLGNNNPYAQDNEITWVDWSLLEEDREFYEFVRRCFAIRRRNAVYRRRRHLNGPESVLASWLQADGTPMQPADWADTQRRTLTLMFARGAGELHDELGDSQTSRDALLLLNADPRTHSFRLPSVRGRGRWQEILNTACANDKHRARRRSVRVAPHSLVVLERGDPT